MPSTVLFIAATLLLSLNLVRLFGLAVSDWLYFGALGFGFLETFLIQRRHAPCWWRNRFLWMVALILFGAVISTMNSRDWGTALVEIFQQIFVMTLFVSLVRIMVRRGNTNAVIFAFILSGVLTAAIGLTDYLTGSKLGPALSNTPDIQLWGRFAGTLGHPNKLGYFLVLTTLLSIGKLFSQPTPGAKWFSRLPWILLIGVQIFGIYISGSMTAYLGLLLGTAIIAVSSKQVFYGTVKGLGMVLVAGLLLVIMQVMFNTILFGNRLNLESTSIAQAFNRIKTTTGETRLKNYNQAWRQITQNPWVGVGYDQISTSGVSSLSRYLDDSVHNALLQIWYTGGLFAFIGWLAIYIMIGWTAFGVLRRSGYGALSVVAISLAAAALAALFMDQFQDAIYQREKWLTIGLLVSLSWESTRVEAVRSLPAPEWTLSSAGGDLAIRESNAH